MAENLTLRMIPAKGIAPILIVAGHLIQEPILLEKKLFTNILSQHSKIRDFPFVECPELGIRRWDLKRSRGIPPLVSAPPRRKNSP